MVRIGELGGGVNKGVEGWRARGVEIVEWGGEG